MKAMRLAITEKKPRICVVRHGWQMMYLQPDLSFKPERSTALCLTPSDAHALVAVDRADRSVAWRTQYLFGSSIEYLPKRGSPRALGGGEFAALLARYQIRLLVTKGQSYDAIAKGYEAQAQYALKMAAESRAMAEEIKKSLKK